MFIYGVHCGKVLVLENIPGRKINHQHVATHEENIPAQYIEDITCLSTLLCLEVNFLVEPFPQCARYMYIYTDIYQGLKIFAYIYIYYCYYFSYLKIR